MHLSISVREKPFLAEKIGKETFVFQGEDW